MTKLADMSLKSEDEEIVTSRSESVELLLRLPLCGRCRHRISETTLTLALIPEEVSLMKIDIVVIQKTLNKLKQKNEKFFSFIS